MKKLTFYFFLLSTSLASAQEPFSLSYANSGSSYIISTAAEANKVAVVNQVVNLTSGLQHHVVSLIENGTPIWNKEFELGSNYIHAFEVGIVPQSEDVVVLFTFSDATGAYANVSRLNASNGEIIWNKHISIPVVLDVFGGFYSMVENMRITNDHHIHIGLSMVDHLRYLEFSENGDLLKSKKINNIDENYDKNPGFCLNQCPNGNYLVSLKDGNYPTIASLNPDFTVAWSQKWTIEGYSHPKVIQQLSSGKIVVTGNGDYGMFVAILSADGELEKYLRSEDIMAPVSATAVFEMDPNQLLLSTGYDTYTTVNLTTNAWKSYTLPYFIRFDKTSTGICAWLENNNNYGIVQCIPSFDPENPACISSIYVQEGILTNTTHANEAIEHNIPFYFKNNGELFNFPFTLTDYAVTSGATCVLSTSELSDVHVEISPNPVGNGEWITIEADQHVKDGMIVLTDLSGKILDKHGMNGMESTIPTKGLAAGTYLVQLIDTSGKLLTSKRVVVQ